MAKKCGTAGEKGALTRNYTPQAASVICHFLRWKCRRAQSKEGIPLQQTCFNWDHWENSRQGNILPMPCCSFFQAAITEEEKGSVSSMVPHPHTSLQHTPFFFSLKQLHLYRCCCSPSQDPAHEKQETEQCCFFSSPVTATWTFLEEIIAVLNCPKPSLGFFTEG